MDGAGETFEDVADNPSDGYFWQKAGDGPADVEPDDLVMSINGTRHGCVYIDVRDCSEGCETRFVHVSPNHPALYTLALKAADRGDRMLMAAVANAAKHGVERDVSLLGP